MATPIIVDCEKAITLQLLEVLFKPAHLEGINVRLWDGSLWPGDGERNTTLVLKHPGALRAMLLPGTELGMAEAYLFDDIDIEGNIEAIFDLADCLAQSVGSLINKNDVDRLLNQLPVPPLQPKTQRGPAKLNGKPYSIARDYLAVSHDSNVSDDVYVRWLDPNMAYFCGYFLNEDDAFEKIQFEKLNTICKKLQLRPGQRLLDIGSGWGGLVICAAQNYGVDATGITLSQSQADHANHRVAELGLSDRCRVIVQDYRETPEARPYDRLVSVGMFEDVREALLNQYFQKAYRLLKPQGVFLNHGIATTQTNRQNISSPFPEQYVFPDGEFVPIHVILKTAEDAGFETRDVESLREPYILSLRQWVGCLEKNHERALHYVDEHTYRVWRVYMSSSIHGFIKRRLNVYQSLFVRSGEDGCIRLPLTRMDWHKN